MVSIFESLKNIFHKNNEKRLKKQNEEHALLKEIIEEPRIIPNTNSQILKKEERSLVKEDINIPVVENNFLIKEDINTPVIENNSLVIEDINEPVVIPQHAVENKSDMLEFENSNSEKIDYQSIYKKHVQNIKPISKSYSSDNKSHDSLYSDNSKDYEIIKPKPKVEVDTKTDEFLDIKDNTSDKIDDTEENNPLPVSELKTNLETDKNESFQNAPISEKVEKYYDKYEAIEKKIEKEKPEEFKKFSSFFSEKSLEKDIPKSGLNRFKNHNTEKSNSNFEFLNSHKKVNSKDELKDTEKQDKIKFTAPLKSDVEDGGDILKKLKKFNV